MATFAIGLLIALFTTIAPVSNNNTTVAKLKKHVDNPGQTPLKDGR